MMTKLLGLLGGICFGYCGVPTSYSTIKQGRSVGTPISIAWMILLGSIFMYSYLALMYGFDLILTVNYSIEAISWGIIVYYHYLPRKHHIKLSKVSFDEFRGSVKFVDVQDTVEK